MVVAANHPRLSTLLSDGDGAVLVGINTGLRRGDLTNLTWGSIDTGSDDTWFLKTKTSKTGKSIGVPFHSDLREWLEARTRGMGKARVFPSLAGKSGSGKGGISKQFNRLMERTGGAGLTAGCSSAHSRRRRRHRHCVQLNCRRRSQ